MDLSHLVSAHSSGGLELSLDLLAFIQAEFDQLIHQQRQSRMPVRVFLGAFFAPKVVLTVLKNSRLAQDILLNQLDEQSLKALIKKLKDIRLPLNGVRGFEYCQVSAGGVPVSEVDPTRLESLRLSGLYLTGETLDVVGPCGGYNLHFAFSSGALAGRAAAGP
jgi:predicted flavoprotein YhiN